ncbi:DUF2764 family protein [Alteromonas sp. ASW11-36]|uniref:DUF2764 family protein n=1 Tax=Alteromonas arenosi TaxID=3055817 RepID=A0ABT7SUF2_9ALTE|nr:DUF2764 family protein [Alteromonas sp. ASW11-36]MDM7859822.1 DUF2764 family protein [Alteromonas sp. ASW11-36]
MIATGSDKYVMLITSLPRPDDLFVAQRTPLSRIKLERRLNVLSVEEKRILQSVERALDWRFLDANLSEQVLSDRDREAYTRVANRTLRTVIRNRLELRTLLAALRMRKQQMPKPLDDQWGFGRWQSHIRRHWNEKDFALSQTFPWLPTAQKYLDNDDPLALEKLILTEAMKQLKRLSYPHMYDFEAVVIYVLKWNLLERSLKMNSYAANKRFQQLIQDCVNSYTEIDDILGNVNAAN